MLEMEHKTELIFSSLIFVVIGEAFFSRSHHHCYKTRPESEKHVKNTTAYCSGTDRDRRGFHVENVEQRARP